MAFVLTTFSDYLCKTETGIPLYMGEAEFSGDWGHLTGSGWASRNGIYYTPNPINPANVSLSGGLALYDKNVPYNLPIAGDEGTESDFYSNIGSLGKVYNISFISTDSVLHESFCISITCGASEYSFEWNMRVFAYTQTVWGDPKSERTAWQYGDPYGAYQAPVCSVHADSDINTDFTQVKVYRATIDETELYVFALFVKPSGAISGMYTRFMAIPKIFFANREPEERTGTVSEDAAEMSFADLRPFYRDELLGFDLSIINTDPLGLCTGGGNTKIAAIDISDYLSLIDGIYCGSSDEFLGSESIADLASQVAGSFNLSGARPVDALQAMLAAIQCVHMIPDIGISVGSSSTIKSIGGYSLGKSVSAKPLAAQIAKSSASTKITARISPRTASFLNYSPYTQAVLVIPYIGNVQIDPSELYAVGENGETLAGIITMEYALDCLTGLLTVYTSAEIPGDYPHGVAKHLINVSQANVAIDLPITGQGGASLTTSIKAISSVINTAMGTAAQFAGGNVAAGIGGLSDTGTAALQAGIDMSKTSCVKNSGIGSIAPYFAPTDAGLILTYPKAVNAGKYAEHIGCISNISGIVNEFEGYAEFINADLSSVQAPEYVKNDILQRLRAGVII